jgi:hypothetical protein
VNAARRFSACVTVLVAVIACPLSGQDSQFGIAGLGTPGRPESAASRSSGGAFAAFDPTSALTEASLTEIGTLTASTVAATSYRSVESSAGNSDLRETRFPMFSLGGTLGRGRLFVGGGFSSYLDRTYGVVTHGTMPLRGDSVAYIDRTTSTGGVGDIRMGAAFRVGSNIALGIGVHLMPGSTRENATRVFADSLKYALVFQAAQVRYEGYGVSASALLTLSRKLAVMAFGRSDGSLKRYVGDTLTDQNNLPQMAGGALRWKPSPSVRFAGSAIWRSWSRAGTNAFNTLNWSVGGEFGSATPLRVGVRGGQLPFGPGATAPTEWGASAGTGKTFARDRGHLDLGLEYLVRDGNGLHESLWTLLVGMTIRP